MHRELDPDFAADVRDADMQERFERLLAANGLYPCDRCGAVVGADGCPCDEED